MKTLPAPEFLQSYTLPRAKSSARLWHFMLGIAATACVFAFIRAVGFYAILTSIGLVLLISSLAIFVWLDRLREETARRFAQAERLKCPALRWGLRAYGWALIFGYSVMATFAAAYLFGLVVMGIYGFSSCFHL